MRSFEYLTPKTVEEACSLLSQHQGEAKVIAGGQSLLILMKQRLIEPSYLIDLKHLVELDYLSFDEKSGLKIGAMVTHRSIETSPIIKKYYGVLSQLEKTLASVQIRNYGTVGGNICHGDPSSDLIPALIVLGAKLKLTGSKGNRSLLSGDFFSDYYETVLQQDEILTEIEVPIMPPNSIAVYEKFSVRRTDSPVVGACVMVTFELGKDVCKDVKIALSAVAPIPVRVKKAEDIMRGKKIEGKLIDEVGAIASETAKPIADIHFSEEYKCKMVKVLIERLFNGIISQGLRAIPHQKF
jgi:carbon-monoxide dehydrogenase medium subunit